MGIDGKEDLKTYIEEWRAANNVAVSDEHIEELANGLRISIEAMQRENAILSEHMSLLMQFAARKGFPVSFFQGKHGLAIKV